MMPSSAIQTFSEGTLKNFKEETRDICGSGALNIWPTSVFFVMQQFGPIQLSSAMVIRSAHDEFTPINELDLIREKPEITTCEDIKQFSSKTE